MTEPQWQRLAKAAADAMVDNVYVGVRSGDRGWFAGCQNIEVDGSSPETAVKGLVMELRSRAQKRLDEAAQTEHAARQQHNLLSEHLPVVDHAKANMDVLNKAIAEGRDRAES